MKTLLVFMLVLLVGCYKEDYEATQFKVLPPELKDCKIFRIQNGNGILLHIARCPNSTTTAIQGNKQQTTTITIDGVDYVKKETSNEKDK